jgi:hypothetical protein
VAAPAIRAARATTAATPRWRVTTTTFAGSAVRSVARAVRGANARTRPRVAPRTSASQAGRAATCPPRDTAARARPASASAARRERLAARQRRPAWIRTTAA